MAIGKTLHFIWFGGPIPPGYQENISRWINLHPDWSFKIWSEPDFGWLEHQDIFDNAEQYAKGREAFQLRSDIARYEILHKHGGLYVDVDTYPLKPIDPYLKRRKNFAVAEDRTWIGNTYLATEPGSELFRFLLDRLRRNIEHGRRRGWRPAQGSGPQFLTPIWRGHQGYVAKTELFFPYSYRDVRSGTVPITFSSDVVAIHEWGNTRSKLGKLGDG